MSSSRSNAGDSGHGVGGRSDGQHHGEQRGEQHGEHRSHVLHHALLGLDEPCRHDYGTRRTCRQDPLDDPLGKVGPDRLEDQRGEPDQHATAERDEHVVDDPLAGEADEVHAPLVRSDRAAHVRVGDREPQHDGQMERDEDLGGRARTVRVEVDHERKKRERRGRQHPSPDVELPSLGEVTSEERQHKQADVAEQPSRFLFRKLSSEACQLNRDARSQGEHERLEPLAGWAPWLVFTPQDKLLPQSATVLACKLSGQGVEVSHPLHPNEERLIGCEAGRVQLGDLIAKMTLQLINVAAVDGLGLLDVRPPLGDL